MKNALFGAAAGNSTGSPLDFILGLMRDPKLPTDIRLQMAAEAARFVHPKKGLTRPPVSAAQSGNLPVAGQVASSAQSNSLKMEAKLSAPITPSEDSSELAPLDFLLSVMNDDDATPQQRIKAARIAAPYRHTHAGRAGPEITIDDPYGFSIDPAIAKVLRDDWYQGKVANSLRYVRMNTPEGEHDRRQDVVRKERRESLDEFLISPPTYTEMDWKNDALQLKASKSKRWGFGKFTPEEDALEAHVYARAEAFLNSGRMPPRMGLQPRYEQLLNRIFAGERLTAEEFSEMKVLDRERDANIYLLY